MLLVKYGYCLQVLLNVKIFLKDCQKTDANEALELSPIKTNILKLIIEWCSYHKNDNFNDIDLEDESVIFGRPRITNLSLWDENFLQLEQSTLMELILASDYLIIEPLKEMCCKVIASWIPGKSPDQLRKLFNITNDFTPEEEEQIRKENAWLD